MSMQDSVCIDQLLNPRATIISISMQDGVFPSDFKQVLINPLIKHLGRVDFSEMFHQILPIRYTKPQLSLKQL